MSKSQTERASLQCRQPDKGREGDTLKVCLRKLLQQGEDDPTSNVQLLLGDLSISGECLVGEQCLIATEVKELGVEGNLRELLLRFPWECCSF